MKATFDGQDYLLVLDREAEELRQLRSGETLEAPLTQPFDGEDLGKLVSVEFAETDAIDGIELNYLPNGVRSWDEIERVQVAINQRAAGYVEQSGRFGTRYDGLGNKIEILNGMPDF